ncbi:hypothetical protein, partial [Escherichia coli]|uniref:EF-Tu C-terminal domain-related protein n=1 Tax=Escherichia coli TaxID=562 RepID=UPI002729E1FD
PPPPPAYFFTVHGRMPRCCKVSGVLRCALPIFTLIHPIAMDDGLRFAIREGGRTVGAGVVAKVLS